MGPGREHSRGGVNDESAGAEPPPPPIIATLEFRAALWIAAAGVIGLLWTAMATVPGVPWNAARLAASFAVAFGQPLYVLRDAGAHLGWFYGPGFPIWYLPVTLTGQPTHALVLAAVGNSVTVIGPVLIVLGAAGVLRGRGLVMGGIVLAALLFGSSVLRWSFYFLHVDAVCVAMGLLGCVALHRAVQRKSIVALHAAALAVAGALWTKQIAVMLGPGLVLWLWFDGHRATIVPFLFWCVVYVGLSTAAIFSWFGAEEVLFNLVLFHPKNPLNHDVGQLFRTYVALAGSLWPWLPLAGCFAVSFWRGRHSHPPSPHLASFLRVLLWVAFTQLPLGLLASMKTGGGPNSLHSVYYLLVAGLMLIFSTISRPSRTVRSARWGGLAWGSSLLITVGLGIFWALDAGARWTIDRRQDELLALVLEKPGRFYLPWNPLITLMADRRVYPFDDALLSLWRSGLEVPPDRVRTVVPAQPIIIYQEPVQSKFALRYFPELETVR